MADFTGMAMMLPLLGIILSFIGAPTGATALMGMVVPMFLMQYIGEGDGGIITHS
jgi:hypothetical protein